MVLAQTNGSKIIRVPYCANNTCANINSVSPCRGLYSSSLRLHLLFMCSLFVRNIKPTSGLDVQLSGANDEEKNPNVHFVEDLKATCVDLIPTEADAGTLGTKCKVNLR